MWDNWKDSKTDQTLRRNWETLLADMETGCVGARVGRSPRWRTFAEARLPPTPRRVRELREYAGKVPVYHFAYAASEGIFGVAEKMNQTDRYILTP
ncbi:MAG: GH3 auxin-responsive promoter family protein [Oscillibacter sp.]|nr:GH3 auxin-responsive promoter family protein [Oscillibacter sp.]